MGIVQIGRASVHLTKEDAERAQERSTSRNSRGFRGCAYGRHLPDTASISCQGTLQTAKCRECGCDIRLMGHSDRWIFSGVLG
jgi:hypothetical protein